MSEAVFQRRVLKKLNSIEEVVQQLKILNENIERLIKELSKKK
jgi:uncharacterized small protein (DUF1192 family)